MKVIQSKGDFVFERYALRAIFLLSGKYFLTGNFRSDME
jgi:hypothetical protein